MIGLECQDHKVIDATIEFHMLEKEKLDIQLHWMI